MTTWLEDCGLVIVDMQNDFVLPDSPLCIAGAFDTIPKIEEALETFRKGQKPVFHIVREHRADGSDVEITRVDGFLKEARYAVPGTRGCEIVEALQPLEGEYRIAKQRFSAFMHTALDFILRRLGISHIVVCGTQYPVCIRTTVFDAIAYGYHVTVLTDATSAQTPEVAEANIRDMKVIGVRCITLSEFLQNPARFGGANEGLAARHR
ncbi:MAG: isochorismatase family cysteine hydrolase [Thermodesulfobacteriota bacterium]|nr:isochorismatase family cysteine hydrolase [Thermodesulfobacteriota bacterium]